MQLHAFQHHTVSSAAVYTLAPQGSVGCHGKLTQELKAHNPCSTNRSSGHHSTSLQKPQTGFSEPKRKVLRIGGTGSQNLGRKVLRTQGQSSENPEMSKILHISSEQQSSENPGPNFWELGVGPSQGLGPSPPTQTIVVSHRRGTSNDRHCQGRNKSESGPSRLTWKQKETNVATWWGANYRQHNNCPHGTTSKQPWHQRT